MSLKYETEKQFSLSSALSQAFETVGGANCSNMTLFCRVRDEPGGMCALQLERSKGRRPALHLPSMGTFSYQS